MSQNAEQSLYQLKTESVCGANMKNLKYTVNLIVYICNGCYTFSHTRMKHNLTHDPQYEKRWNYG